ncbi:MAG: hypothetical protein OQK75_11855, partial [Gammaproteobacteria bacterium]|nr:hypothetical protein [Gammaproteobacteria bacterium]
NIMETWFLIILISFGNAMTEERVYTMPSMDACLKSVSTMKVNVSQGAENEQAVVAVCAQRKTELGNR